MFPATAGHFMYLRSVRFLCLFAVCSAAASAAPSRIATPVNTARRASLQQNRAHPATRAAFDQGAVDPALPISYASLILKPGPGLEIFLAEQQDPASPNYHRWLSPAQFGDRFGVSRDDLARLRQWLQSEGLRVHDAAQGGLWITFSGTALQVNRAFRTELRRYRSGVQSHFANATGLSIPAAMEPVVESVAGLDDYEPSPLYRRMEEDVPAFTGATGHTLAPDDIATIYNIRSLYNAGIDGTGQKIAVIGRTNLDLADVRAFRRRFNLPPNDPQIVLFGPDPGTSPGDVPEANLDLQWSGAVARNATIIYVNSTSVRTSAQYAVDQNLAPVITYSYGICEQYTSQNQRGVAQQAAAQGITWLVASGDSLAATCDANSPIPLATRGATTSYPATIPEVTAVGGTEFNEGAGNYWNATNDANLASAISWIPEKPWNNVAARNGLIGGGGGASAFFTKPPWQSGSGVPNDGARDVPDISLAASAIHDGYQVVSGGAVRVFGGTSVSAPVFAGIIALLNQSLKQPGVGNINPALYRLARSASDAFHDVTEGDIFTPCQQGSPNCVEGKLGFAAGIGYDLATGWGSVDAARLVSVWNAGTVSTTTLAAPAGITAADKVQLVATVRGAAGTPTGAVTFVSNDTAIGFAQLVSGVASLSAEGAIIAGGNGAVFASYGGDAIYAPSSGQAAVTLKLPLAGSAVVPSILPFPVLQNGTAWPYTIRLTERAGVATTLTAFTVDGVNNLAAFANPAIAASGSLSVSLVGRNLTPPQNRVYHFEGADADGAKWNADLTVPFIGPAGPSLAPSLTLSAFPATIQRNPLAAPDCQWQAQFLLQERSGFQIVLTAISISGSTVANLAQIFGTSRLGAFGVLKGTWCFAETATAGNKNILLLGQDENGSLVQASAIVTLAAPAAAPAKLSVSVQSVSLSVPDASQTATSSINVSLSGESSNTIATVVSQSPWLTVSQTSGTVGLRASGTGLSRGAYAATIVIQATGAVPQAISVPVFFTVGASATSSISGVTNAASFAPGFAPGMLLAVFGSGLAPGISSAAIQPLPYSLQGVSATVNGIAAPLWFVSPAQLNIQIPYEITAGPAVLAVNNNGEVASWVFSMGVSAPGIFLDAARNLVPFPNGSAGQTVVAFITGDGDVAPSLPTGTSPAPGTSLSRLPSSRQAVSITVNGAPAKIVFNGIVPGLIGVTQLNFTIPENLVPGVYPVIMTVGGVSSAPGTFTVK